jgi:hypothetical protein
MRQRGRLSRNADLTVLPFSGQREHPAAPAFLQPDEAEQWDVYVRAMPPDWFPAETQPLLAELCQSITYSHRVAAELHAIGSLSRDESFQKFMELLRAKIQVSALIMQLSTKMRLTNQSRLRSEKASALAENRFPKPWDLTGDDVLKSEGMSDESEPPDWGPRPSRKN